MSEDITPSPPTGSALLRNKDQSGQRRSLERAAGLMLPALKEMLAGNGVSVRGMVAGECQTLEGDGLDGSIFLEFAFGAAGAFAMLTIARPVFHELVDRYYGGDGQNNREMAELGAADLRYIGRLAQQLTPIIQKIFAAPGLNVPQLNASGCNLNESRLGRSQGALPSVAISLSEESRDQLHLICHPALLEMLQKSPHPSAAADEVPADPDWLEQLAEAAMEIHLPLRTIFARPEIALSRLLTLKNGDIIPVCLPARVPVTVCGRRFAEGTIGEANGRTAVKIDKIETRKKQP